MACISFVSVKGQLHGYSASVTDASVQSCNDGAIDLNPPAQAFGFGYTWYRDGQNQPYANSEDLANIPPGKYTVYIDGPLCFDFQLTYFVGVREYDFEVTYINPSNCHTGKVTPQNGIVIVSWNTDVTPPPVVTHSSSVNPLISGIPLGNLNPGEHQLSFSIGNSCSWIYQFELCCCSVENELELGELGASVCEHLLDDEPLIFEVLSVNGASGPNETDGNINMRLTSPGPNHSIKWTGPIGSPASRSFYSTSLRGVLPGVYQYDYEDDCQSKQGTVVVDDCSSEEIAPILSEEEVVGTCPNTNDGSITLDIGLRHRDFNVFLVDRAGDTGQEILNFTILNENEVFTRIKFDELRYGTHIYRFITEQGCEADITFGIPYGELTYENEQYCSRDQYCNGVLVGTESGGLTPQKTAYCFIVDMYCEITGTSKPNSLFDENLAYNPEWDAEAGTCKFLYACEDGLQEIKGNIDYKLLSTACNVDELGFPRPRINFLQVCKASFAGDVSVSVPIQDAPMITIDKNIELDYDNCDGCSGSYTADFSVSFSETPYPAVNFSCCGRCPVLSSSPKSVSVIDDRTNVPSNIDCLLRNSNSKVLVNIGNGQSFTLSKNQWFLLEALLSDGNMVLESAKLNSAISPGAYYLTSQGCDPIYIAII